MNRFFFLFVLLKLVSVQSQTEMKVLLNPVCFNNSGNDFGIRNVKGKLYFVSDFKDSTAVRNRHLGRRYTDVYEVEGCRVKEAKLVKNSIGYEVSINSKWFDGPISYSIKDSVLFFSNTSEGHQHGKMGIYWSKELPDGAFTEPKSLPLNSRDYSCMHPFFDESTSMLYFSSDMGADTAGFDLFRIYFDKGEFGELENLSGVNSSANDLFPAIYDGVLYFSSNRIGGYGGLDLYKWDFQNNVSFLKEPFNSEADDFALIFTDTKRGYFSSNRNTQDKNDEIYELYIPSHSDFIIQSDTSLVSLVNQMKDLIEGFDKDSPESLLILAAIDKLEKQQKLIQNLQIEMIERRKDIENYLDTSSMLSFEDKVRLYEDVLNGQSSFVSEVLTKLPESINQSISDYLGLEGNLADQNLKNLEEKSFFDDKLVGFISNGKIMDGDFNEIVSHYEINDTSISQILAVSYPMKFYFGFDKFELNEEELNKLKEFVVRIISHNGSITIEGHTDSKGSIHYNNRLSIKRAKHIAKLIEELGVDGSQIKVTGKGELEPEEDNNSEEGRAKNRRVVIRL